MEDGEQVLVEIGGTYELVDRNHLITPETVESDSKEEKEDIEREASPEQLTSTSDGEASSEQSPSPKQEVTRATSPDTRVTQPEENVAITRATSLEQNPRPASVQSLRSSSQPLLHTKQYKQYERTSTPKRQPKRPMSARPASSKVIKKPHQIDQEAIQRREMADVAFEHWKKQKDKELVRKKRETRKKEEYEKNGSNNHKQIVEKQGPFDAWLENKTRQRAQQKEVEKLRAQIITSELLSVDYSESELAYERWLKQKNQSKRAESREKDKKRQEDKEEMKTVLNNIKTRWRIDYNKSRYLHPNNIRGWDDTPVYSNGPPVLPW